MTADQMGRTAPWAKALGAVLLVLLTVVLVAFGIGRSREAARKDAAFEATREDARRFADAVVAQPTTRPVDRQAAKDALASVPGSGSDVLFAVVPTDGTTRVTLEFARVYERSLAIFGPAEDRAYRCFTIVFRESDQGRQAQITPHGSNESCTEVARQGQ